MCVFLFYLYNYLNVSMMASKFQISMFECAYLDSDADVLPQTRRKSIAYRRLFFRTCRMGVFYMHMYEKLQAM